MFGGYYYATAAAVFFFTLLLWLLRPRPKKCLTSSERNDLYREFQKVQTLSAALDDTNAYIARTTNSIGNAAEKLRGESLGMMAMFAHLPEGERHDALFAALKRVERSCDDLTKMTRMTGSAKNFETQKAEVQAPPR